MNPPNIHPAKGEPMCDNCHPLAVSPHVAECLNALDSNDLQTTIHSACYECGVTANVLTCLKKYGQPPKQLAYQISTYHTGECDFCGKTTSITEARDFFYPDFSLIPLVAGYLKV